MSAIKRYNQLHPSLPLVFLSKVEEFKRDNTETTHDDGEFFEIFQTLIKF